MPDFKRIAGLNLGILLAAAVLLRLLIREEYEFGISGYAMLMAVIVFVQAFTNLVAASLADTTGRRWAFLLNTLLVLLIGLGVCGVGAESIPRTRSIPVFHRPPAGPLASPALPGTGDRCR